MLAECEDCDRPKYNDDLLTDPLGGSSLLKFAFLNLLVGIVDLGFNLNGLKSFISHLLSEVLFFKAEFVLFQFPRSTSHSQVLMSTTLAWVQGRTASSWWEEGREEKEPVNLI